MSSRTKSNGAHEGIHHRIVLGGLHGVFMMGVYSGCTYKLEKFFRSLFGSLAETFFDRFECDSSLGVELRALSRRSGNGPNFVGWTAKLSPPTAGKAKTGAGG